MEIRQGKEDVITLAPSRASTATEHDEDTQKDHRPVELSRTTSVNPEAIVVERRKRRGLFASLSMIPEVENPYHYARKTKWLLTIIVAFCGMAGPMGSAIVVPVLQDISKAFNASDTITNMNVAVYMLAMGVFPLFWSSFSETSGRRTIYLISFTLFVVFGVLSAISTNMAMLIVFRTFSGGAAASVQAVGAGTIADIWEVKERGRAMGLFYLGPLCGPLFAPIIGGALAEKLGWRSTQWFLVIYGGVTVLLLVFVLPETLRSKTPTVAPLPASTPGKRPTENLSRVSTRQSVAKKSKSILSHLRRTFIDPFSILLYIRFLPVLCTVYYASITFAALYFLNISIQKTFSAPPYNFSTLIVGLLYIPNSVGYLLASVFGGMWIDRIMHREARKAGRYDDKGKLIFRPEDRLRENAWIAAFLWPAALIWYGWSVEKGIAWIVPMVANFFFGVGSMLIFSVSSTMLTEFMPSQSSAGIAINNFCRNVFVFGCTIAADPAINKIGNGWLFTIVGLWSLGTGALVLVAMSRNSARWRDSMVKAMGE
ncbi:MFS general substrate transporter [Amniculicola lignicola CBS 123094]|uniref:MFS general substrate transporter n=1 Tax=Amniculicola lignicola CBS 123094 TaxID=1392246 RepID=A0A6A5X548_9PLEO|nr:MFS general substrate transporter [Amniculicola lignicola CBS 123094]